MDKELSGQELEVLRALQSKPLRFSEIKKLVKMNNRKLERILELLSERFYIFPKTIPDTNPILVEYVLGKLGKSIINK